MPRMKEESFGGSDMSWLLNDDDIASARTELVDISTFTKNTHYPNGYILSGTPVAKVGGVLIPFDTTVGTTTGAGVIAGHILTDQQTDGVADFAVPLFAKGQVKASKVPGTSGFAAAVAVAAKRGNTNTIYV